MTRNYVKSIRVVHITGEDSRDKLIISARFEMKRSTDSETLANQKTRLEDQLMKFMSEFGYHAADIKFHKSRQ
jgi:hypothetical protein